MELTIITGMSGAGKSQAMGSTFEDAGWFCVDNLPPGLLRAADLVLLEGSRVERAAVVCDVRGGVWFRELEPCSSGCRGRAASSRVVFLEASTRRSSTASARPAGRTRCRPAARWPTASSASAPS